MGFSLILKFLTGFLSGPLGVILKEIRMTQEIKAKAANEKERIQADERLAVLDAQKQAIISSQPDLIWRLCRAGFALPFIVYINKVVIWDKVLGWGVTDNLSADLWYLLYTIVGGFFLEVGARIMRKH